MSTRGALLVYQDGEYVLSQYNHHDSYPRSLGSSVVKFLESASIKNLEDSLQRIQLMESEEFERLRACFGTREEFERHYPTLGISPGTLALEELVKGEKVMSLANLPFVADGLFCEWVYVIDMDSECLEVYKGFNNKSLNVGDRFWELQVSRGHHNGYYPAKFAGSFSFKVVQCQADSVLNILNKIQDGE